MDSFPDSVAVNGDDGVDVRRVAAAHRDDDREIAVAAGIEHHAIARPQPVDRELQAA
jgi:hypothetical protein